MTARPAAFAPGASGSPVEAEPALAALRGDLAERLLRLITNVGCPAGAGATIRAWLDLIRADEPAALELEELEKVLRALTVFYIDRFAYAGHKGRRWRPGQPVDLEMTDRGGALLVRHLQARVADLALARHGPAGRVLLRRVRDAEQEMVRSIAVMIGRVV